MCVSCRHHFRACAFPLLLGEIHTRQSIMLMTIIPHIPKDTQRRRRRNWKVNKNTNILTIFIWSRLGKFRGTTAAFLTTSISWMALPIYSPAAFTASFNICWPALRSSPCLFSFHTHTYSTLFPAPQLICDRPAFWSWTTYLELVHPERIDDGIASTNPDLCRFCVYDDTNWL